MAAGESASGPRVDYLMMMVQHLMLNAAGGGLGRQTTADRAVGQCHLCGECSTLHVSVCSLP